MKCATVAVVLAWMLAVSAVHASETAPHLELSASGGLGHTFGRTWDRSAEVASSNGGLFVGVEAAYRSPYLFVPWLQLGWAELLSSEERPKSEEFAEMANSRSSLTTSYALLGPAVEEGPMRFRVGIGVYRVQVTSTFAGTTATPAEWDMGYFVGYGVRVRQWNALGLGIDAQGLLMSESSLAFFGLALRGWYDWH